MLVINLDRWTMNQDLYESWYIVPLNIVDIIDLFKVVVVVVEWGLAPHNFVPPHFQTFEVSIHVCTLQGWQKLPWVCIINYPKTSKWGYQELGIWHWKATSGDKILSPFKQSLHCSSTWTELDNEPGLMGIGTLNF